MRRCRRTDLPSRRGARGALLVALASALLPLVEACSQQTIVLPSRDFDRPTDLAFGCIGIFKGQGGEVVLSGQPMDRCHPPETGDPKPSPVAPAMGAQYRTFGYLTNAGRGDLSVLDFSFCRPDDGTCFPPGADIVDLDSESPGFTAAPVGELPEVVAASQDGCRVVTANRGSCDLTVVDPSTLLSRKWGGTADPRRALKTVPVITSTGRVLNVAPAEIAFLPQQTANLGGMSTLCGAGDPAGDPAGTLAAPVGAPAATAESRASWRVIATFPSCDLIAVVDLPSGEIKSSFRITATATTSGSSALVYQNTGTDPVCPRTDCGERATQGCGDLSGGGGAAGSPGGGGGAAGAMGGGGGGGGDGGAMGGVAGSSGAAGAGGATPTGGVGGDVDAGAGAGGDAGAAGTDAVGGAGGTAGIGGDAGAGGAAGSLAALAIATVPGDACPGLRVGPLAIRPEGKRVYFGAANVPLVGALDIQGGDTLVEPATGKSTELHEGAAGSLRLRLSVDPFGYITGRDPNQLTNPEYGRFVSAVHPEVPFQFLYVIARDATLRAVDVSTAVPVECDLAIDPTDPKANATVTPVVSGQQVTDGVIPPPAACFPVGAPNGPRRLPYWAGVEPHVAGGPGLHFPNSPVDIAVGNFLTAELKDLTSTTPLTVPANETVLNGAYGLVLTSSGLVYVLNVDPVLRQTARFVRGSDPALARVPARVTESPLPLANSLRDTGVVTYSTSLGSFSGPPRLDADPLQSTLGPRLHEFKPADPNVNTTDSSINARAVPIVDTNGAVSESNALLSTFVYFPNRFLVRPQTWQVTWEGAVSGTRYSGVLDATGDPSAFTLRDPGAPFCGVGVLPGDIVTLPGCLQDSDCPTRVCVHSQRVFGTVDSRTIGGLCLPPRMAVSLRDGQCRELLESFRRYEVTAATSSLLTLQPKIVEYPRPMKDMRTCDGSQQNATCKGKDDCPTSYCCQPVEPVENQPINRCVRICTTSANCTQGTHCHKYATGSFCSEGADIDHATQQACLDQLALYSVNAGNTFLVSGSVAGRPDVVTQRQADQACTRDEQAATSVRISRIPMTTPDCVDPPPGPWTDLDLAGAHFPSPNPCVVRPESDKTVKTASVWFQNQELRFVLENFDQPFAFTSTTPQMSFEVHGGLSPMQVPPLFDATPTLPSRILIGPVSALQQLGDMALNPSSGFTALDGSSIPESKLPYLYVVDQRQYAGGRLIGRGQLLRIHPRVSSIAPGFEGTTSSNHYFPIQ